MNKSKKFIFLIALVLCLTIGVGLFAARKPVSAATKCLYLESSRQSNFKQILGGSSTDVKKLLTDVNLAPLNPTKFKNTKVKIHCKVAAEFQAAIKEIGDLVQIEARKNPRAPYKPYIQSFETYNWRCMRNSSYLSNHSFATAVDINATENPYCNTGNKDKRCSNANLKKKSTTDKYTMPASIINIMKKHGFDWGGDWSAGNKDYMHFEIRPATVQARATFQCPVKTKAGPASNKIKTK